MKYWILALARTDMERCVEIGTFGLKRKYILGRVHAGDKVACYVTKEYKIIAVGEATSDYYMDDSEIFHSDGVFADRIDIKCRRLNPELNFMDFIDRMSFIKNLAYWSVYLRSGIVEISAKDWSIIESSVRKSSISNA